ncbi:YndJ family transporter [Kitasatospora sp. NPDC018058]|uniref:YndJ family transporter n=1 Tax=Kitasatospora sp. NPDC018058 TaxID=3364025 RepID=UPI0037C17308
MGAVLPVGLTLIDEPGLARIRRLWSLAAVLGALSLWLPRGALATGPAVVYALGTLAVALHAPLRLPHPTLAWMAATHGLGNAVGFALCALLAWRRVSTAAETPR